MLVAAILTLAATAIMPVQGDRCDREADELVSDGWTAYRENAIARADSLFQAASDRCGAHLGAIVGRGYAALRLERLDEARRLFDSALVMAPETLDALVGLGLVSWRQGDPAAALDRFDEVLALEPDNETARQYRRLLAPSGEPPRRRPPPALPESLVVVARAQGDRFDVTATDGWRPFYVKGVNLGAALPGKYPSEFPDSATYTLWIAEIVEMGANTVRLYTIHPPHFYRALQAHNASHPERPLWVIHGVWAELPPDHDYDDPVWKTEFFNEMRRVVDLVHGRADVESRPGHASGRYTADVSRWVLAYVIGREWEPFSVKAYNAMRPERRRWEGEYLVVADGSPMEVWLAEACESIVAYESTTYRMQRPVAYTNWPPLDPMPHPTETTVDEEVMIREALGEVIERPPLEYDNDDVSLDATRMRPTGAYPAGPFAVFHAYPYYPDFMVLDPGYGRARSSEGQSNYFGYLRELKDRHRGMPVLIGEYGVPASLGIAHLQPQGWHHGGHSEEAMADIDARLTREIAEAGMAGAAVFAWIDEWFKTNWIVLPFEIPRDRGRMWTNRLDAEQHYGMIAMEPETILGGAHLPERLAAWAAVPALYEHADRSRLRAAADEAHLWLLFEPGRVAYEEIFIGFDVTRPDAGDFRWPGSVGPAIPVGVELVLRISRDGARILVDPASNPYRVVAVRDGAPTGHLVVPRIDDGTPPGLFSGRVEQRYNEPYRTAPNHDGRYDSLRVVVNRPRFSRDGTEYAGLGYDRSVLPPGPPPDGVWERDERTGAVEVRIPWMLLNVTDPSRRRVLDGGAGAEYLGGFGTVTVESIGIVAAATDTSGWWHFWPAPASPHAVARFQWETWDAPTWRARRRPVYERMRETFDRLRPAVLDR